MRLNDKTYPAYNLLETKKFEYLKLDQMFKRILPTDLDFYNFLNSLKEVNSQVNKKYYLTAPFKDAILTAMPKIMHKNKHFNEIPTDCGVIFTDKGFSIYLSNPTDKKLKLLVYGFTRDVLTTYGYIDNDDMIGGIACSQKNNVEYDDQETLVDYMQSFLVALYFIHNCELEQKILQPNDKYRSNGDKHYNESKSDLTILDCKWFTELIRDAPFHVKGHLRWQVHGQKFSKRKLIWISDFEKNGYHYKPFEKK
jgi:hypothetical protein